MMDAAESFEPQRRRLLGLAYRMLGSVAEAEDAVQDAYLRWHATDREVVADARAFLTTTTARICLDALKSARMKREQYVGPWLPEPVVDAKALAPDAQTELAEDLSVALLLAMERLSPLERAAFLLHDVFDCSYDEVARALERSEAACRQLAARARGHVREARPRSLGVENVSEHRKLVAAFVAAARSGDVGALTAMLARDARMVSDGGGKVAAALNVIEGAERTAKFVAGVVNKGLREGSRVVEATINGLVGVLIYGPEGGVQSTAFEIKEGRIHAIYVVRNPEKLMHLEKGPSRPV
jgi:RNA polymerase sigma-70 factor, ECF subfamily